MNYNSFNYSFYNSIAPKCLRDERPAKLGRIWLNYVSKQMKGFGKVLDLGSGDGFLSLHLTKQGHEVIGSDLSENLINYSKKRAKNEKVNVKFVQADMLKLPFTDNYFDAIVSIGVAFNHMITKKDQIQALKEMKRVCRSNGKIILDLGNHRWKGAYVKNMRRTKDGDVIFLPIDDGKNLLTIRNLTQKDMHPLLKEVGFSNWSYDYSFYRRRILQIEV